MPIPRPDAFFAHHAGHRRLRRFQAREKMDKPSSRVERSAARYHLDDVFGCGTLGTGPVNAPSTPPYEHSTLPSASPKTSPRSPPATPPPPSASRCPATAPALPPEMLCFRPMKVVGRRNTDGDPLRDAAILQRTVRKLQGNALVPKGVYRFASHEEANEWMIQTIAHTHAHRSSKTSSDSAER
jgi:hypothetical protein